MNFITDNNYDLIVIGGGPAGMMAAGRAGELLYSWKRQTVWAKNYFFVPVGGAM